MILSALPLEDILIDNGLKHQSNNENLIWDIETFLNIKYFCIIKLIQASKAININFPKFSLIIWLGTIIIASKGE